MVLSPPIDCPVSRKLRWAARRNWSRGPHAEANTKFIWKLRQLSRERRPAAGTARAPAAGGRFAPFPRSLERHRGNGICRHAATGDIKACLLLFQAGGVSQTDTFDMKPDCDETIRGEFRPVDSNVPGMPVCEHLPLVARQMDKVCVVRSVHHRMLCHNPAIYAALSGAKSAIHWRFRSRRRRPATIIRTSVRWSPGSAPNAGTFRRSSRIPFNCATGRPPVLVSMRGYGAGVRPVCGRQRSQCR